MGERHMSEEEIRAATGTVVENETTAQETAGDLAAIEAINAELEAGVDGNNPEAIVRALEKLQHTPDTVVTARQRDDTMMGQIKSALHNLRTELLNPDNYIGQDGRKMFAEFGGDVATAARTLWNKSDNSFREDLVAVSEKFYHKINGDSVR
ncbi:MAG: hypothetical protein PHY34_03990 [Patescibacteria group bacterium]|nr:hypothetical protein [Patescibacteria group bacterium]MDD5715513.1 hypothetical protein [Patescibacteria group bacterium]